MLNTTAKFDELVFFAQVKKRPGVFLGKQSLLSLRDQLFGMSYAFSFNYQESPLKYFNLFVAWYHEELIKNPDVCACWWNHILYTSGNDDVCAFKSFFSKFEKYLLDVHNVCLPEVT